MDCSSEQLLKSVKASLCSSLGVVLEKKISPLNKAGQKFQEKNKMSLKIVR